MFNPYDPDFLENPYPTYARLIRESPVFHDETWGLTFVARHGDVMGALKDRETFGRDFRHRLSVSDVDPVVYRRIYPSQWPTWTEYIRESFIDLEPPRHTRLRRLVSKAFTRRSSEVFRSDLETAADGILDRALELGELEVIRDFATPIPVAMIAQLMGIPADDHARLIDWSHAIVRVFDERVTEEEGAAAEAATKNFVAYLEEMLGRRRSRPGNDLLSAMLDVEEEGDTLSDAEIVSTAILTLNAGHEATVHAIGNSLLALARDPAAYATLVDGSASIGSTVDELLRFDSPLQMFERWALADTSVGGHEIRAGTKVGLLFGAANHDPAVYEQPSVLDLAREPNPHVSFGAGLHYCVGAPLAKVELEAALGRFAARVARIELVDMRDRIDSLVFRGIRELRLELEAG
jgi:unspecific monooxygenase